MDHGRPQVGVVHRLKTFHSPTHFDTMAILQETFA
jgi:hypothetical protein